MATQWARQIWGVAASLREPANISAHYFLEIYFRQIYPDILKRKSTIYSELWVLKFILNLEFTTPSGWYFDISSALQNLIASLKLFRQGARATNGQCPWLESRARLFHFGRARGSSHRHTRMYQFAWKGIIWFESARPEKIQINLDKIPFDCSWDQNLELYLSFVNMYNT